MINQLDQQIARVLAELNQLRQRKLETLRRQMEELENAGEEASSIRRRTHRSFTDEEAKEILVKIVEAAESGISARKAAEESGISYARVRLLMPKLFRKTGSGRQTLYVLRKKRGG